MKQILLAVIVWASSTTPSGFPLTLSTNASDPTWWAMGGLIQSNTNYAIPSVDCGTPTVVVPALSTGPFTLKNVSGQCNQFDYVNPNGTTVPAAGRYIACPK